MKRQSKRVFSMFLTLMMFMFTIGQSLVPMIANAQELATTGFVDSFTIGKTSLSYGERTQITVNFSDKSGNQMKAGDTLTLTLPPELVGFSGTIPLKNDAGTEFGTVKITTTEVICTFSDVVETLQNIRGYFTFTVSGMNVPTGETKTIETNLGTTLEKQAVTISGPTVSTDPGIFFYKAGDIQPENTNEVRWFLAINNNKQELNTDITVSDSVQSGQTLNKNSLYIIINGPKYLQLTLQEFQDQGYGTITFTGDNSFDVLIYKDTASGNSIVIGYKATITESGKKQDFFKNDYKIEYQIKGEQSVSNSGTARVKNIDMGGAADGDLPPKGTLRIVKHIAGNEDKIIPNVSFKLYKESGEQIGGTLTTDAQGKVEIPNLIVGNYYVQEISAPDYLDFDPQAKVSFTMLENADKGVELKIPNKVKTTSISGTKTWNDNNATDRPSSIKVDLLQNGTVINTQDVTAINGWSYTFADVPAYDTDGNAYTYTVKEQPVAGYISEVKGYDITNTKVVQITIVEGTKTWKDNNSPDRPSSIKVDLLRNGQVIQTQDVTAANGWKYTFDNLAAYDANGKTYTYTVKEQPVAGYTSEVNGYNITNTKVVQTTTVEGTKTWKDDNAADRPGSIKVDLLQNGQVIKTQEVTAANGWKYTFENLAVTDADGKAFTYSVKEQPVAGYTSEVHGYDITNTKVVQTTSVEGTKTWKDDKTTDRPSAIKVDLLQNGQVIKTQEVTAANGWKYTFANLAVNDTNGKAYTYTVKEQAVAGYKSEVHGYDITNTKVGQTKVEGTKTWKDDNATNRPSTIRVDLLQNGQVIQTQEVTAANGWKYTFDNLAAYDADGKAFTYSVKEQPVAGYKSEVHGYDITNTKVRGSVGPPTNGDGGTPSNPGGGSTTDPVNPPTVVKTKVEGTKTWKDDKATDRPSSIKVDLLQNGTVIRTQEVTVANGWKYTFADLAANDASGKAYTYEVQEQPVDGYQSEVHGYDITNTKTKDPVNPLPPVPGGSTTVEGTKAWKDDKASDRPNMILVDLLQNGEVIQTQKVTAANGWKYTFADLTTYDDEGNEYLYEVKEQPVAGYKSEVHGYDITNTKIKNSKPTDPKTTDTQTNGSKPSKGDDKTVGVLPKTGESSTGMILEVVGMLLLILGVILFVRPRTQ